MNLRIVSQPIPLSEWQDLAAETFGDMVKVVVDLNRSVLAVGGEMHADEEALLLDAGSEQEDLWGANIYPFLPREDRIVFTALINIRPGAGNRSLEIQDKVIRKQVRDIIESLILG